MVSKKTYSYKDTIPQSTSETDATLKITFTTHPFYAKIIAQLIDNNDSEVSTMIIDLAGGERGGDGTPLDIALGPISIFGNTSTNPWSSTIVKNTTEVSIAPTSNFNTGQGSYSVFIEYISPNTSGAITSIERGSTGAFTFGY